MSAGLAWSLQVAALLLAVTAVFVGLLFRDLAGWLIAEAVLFGLAGLCFLAGRLLQRRVDRSTP
jgi:hypothetical protein